MIIAFLDRPFQRSLETDIFFVILIQKTIQFSTSVLQCALRTFHIKSRLIIFIIWITHNWRTDKIVKMLIRASSGIDVFPGKILELQNKDVLTFAFPFFSHMRMYSLFYKWILNRFVHVWASSYLKVRYVRCQYTRTSVGQRRSVYLEWKICFEENRAPDLNEIL